MVLIKIAFGQMPMSTKNVGYISDGQVTNRNYTISDLFGFELDLIKNLFIHEIMDTFELMATKFKTIDPPYNGDKNDHENENKMMMNENAKMIVQIENKIKNIDFDIKKCSVHINMLNHSMVRCSLNTPISDLIRENYHLVFRYNDPEITSLILRMIDYLEIIKR